jgi:hypothetical protein
MPLRWALDQQWVEKKAIDWPCSFGVPLNHPFVSTRLKDLGLPAT